MKRGVLLLLITCLILTLAACGERQADVPAEPESKPAEEEPTEPEQPKYLPETSEEAKAASKPEQEDEAARKAALEARLRTVVEGMTLDEKVGQLFFVQCPRTQASDKIAQYHLGGLLFFTRDYKDNEDNWLTAEQLTAKIKAFQLTAEMDTGISLYIGSDEEGGDVTRASRNPNLFPSRSKSPQELYNSGGIGAVLNDAAQKNDLLKKFGVNVNFAPVVDVSTDPNDFIYSRSLGKNAAETMAYAAGVVSVMNDEGVGAVLKHFPGYGNNADTHTGIAVDERPLEWFEKSDLVPFLAGIRANAPFVLVSHNIVKCMDETLPASLSPAVHRILRDMGFEGVALTDDLSMKAVAAYAADGSVAVLALQAGNDMVVTADFETQIPLVIQAVQDGTLDESVIDAACLRVLTIKYRLGLLKLG